MILRFWVKYHDWGREKSTLGRITQEGTSHGKFEKYLHKCNIQNFNYCCKCSNDDILETVRHIIRGTSNIWSSQKHLDKKSPTMELNDILGTKKVFTNQLPLVNINGITARILTLILDFSWRCDSFLVIGFGRWRLLWAFDFLNYWWMSCPKLPLRLFARNKTKIFEFIVKESRLKIR